MDILSLLASFIINAQDTSNMDRDLERLQTIQQRWADEERERDFNARVGRVKKFLEQHRSPLADEADVLVRVADRFNLDYRLLPAISGKESTFCKYYRPETFNCWGWGPHIKFDSFESAIYHIGESLSQRYDTSSVRSIGYKYAPPTENDTEGWITTVEKFIKEI
jgi:hypothetical protein